VAKTTGSLGDNIAYELDGNNLVLKIDLSKRGAPTKSDKNIMVASTGGASNVGGVKVSLNAYTAKG
jgi:hypothetical protein